MSVWQEDSFSHWRLVIISRIKCTCEVTETLEGFFHVKSAHLQESVERSGHWPMSYAAITSLPTSSEAANISLKMTLNTDQYIKMHTKTTN